MDLPQLWRYRDVVIALAARDIKLRYRQTFLGVAWVIFQPLIGAGIFSFVFGKMARLDAGGMAYFLFAYAGLLAWNVFSGTVTKASGSLVQNAPLVSKIFFPRLLIPLATVVSTLLDFAVALMMMFALLATYRVWPGPALMWLPVWLALILSLALGCGLIAAALAVSYRDVQHILPVFMQLLLFASPIAYSVAAVPDTARPFFFLNPLCVLLEGFRWSLLGRGSFHADQLACSMVLTLVILFVGLFIFQRTGRHFADVI